jgi:hypothetical protein
MSANAKLQKAYDAFVQKCGSELAKTMAIIHGAVNGLADDVPADRADACANAMNRIMSGGAFTMAQLNSAMAAAASDEPESQDDVFAGIRAKAFRKPADDADADAPKPVAKLDPVEIFARWNRARAKRTED